MFTVSGLVPLERRFWFSLLKYFQRWLVRHRSIFVLFFWKLGCFFFFFQNWCYYSDATIQNHFSGTFTQIDVKMKFISRLMCFLFFLPSGNCLHCVISHPLKLSGNKYWITSFSCLFFRQFIGSEKLPLLYFCLLTSMSVSMKITPPATCRIFAVTVVSFHSANGGFHAFRESLCSLLGFLLKTQTFQIYKKNSPPSLLSACLCRWRGWEAKSELV